MCLSRQSKTSTFVKVLASAAYVIPSVLVKKKKKNVFLDCGSFAKMLQLNINLKIIVQFQIFSANTVSINQQVHMKIYIFFICTCWFYSRSEATVHGHEIFKMCLPCSLLLSFVVSCIFRKHTAMPVHFCVCSYGCALCTVMSSSKFFLSSEASCILLYFCEQFQ